MGVSNLILQQLNIIRNMGKITFACSGLERTSSDQTWSWHAGPEPLAGEASGSVRRASLHVLIGDTSEQTRVTRLD